MVFSVRKNSVNLEILLVILTLCLHVQLDIKVFKLFTAVDNLADNELEGFRHRVSSKSYVIKF